MGVQPVFQNTHGGRTQLATLDPLAFLGNQLIGQHIEIVRAHRPLRHDRIGHARSLARGALWPTGRRRGFVQTIRPVLGLTFFFEFIVFNVFSWYPFAPRHGPPSIRTDHIKHRLIGIQNGHSRRPRFPYDI